MKTVIEMAREAGLHRTQHNLMSNPVQQRFSYDGYEENLKRFAELVRADAIADERELRTEALTLLQTIYMGNESKRSQDILCSAMRVLRKNEPEELAAAIRARGRT